MAFEASRNTLITEVFAHVDAQADALLEDLEERRVDVFGQKSTQPVVPETPIHLWWSSVPSDAYEFGGSVITAAITFCGLDGLGSHAVRAISRSYVPLNDERVGIRVAAPRGLEQGNDFTLDQDLRSISVGVRDKGFHCTGEFPATGDLIGCDDHERGKRFGDLASADRERLNLVVGTMLGRIEAVDRILDGADPFEELTNQGMLLTLQS